jgi:Fur family transcriptional regulator, ferric uptake regulator
MTNRELKKAGLKKTLPRKKILAILEKSANQHLSAEDIYQILRDQHEDIGLATIYRVLAQFEISGLVKRRNFEGGSAVFELDQGEHHDHFVCLACGQVVEFSDALIEKQQLIIANKFGFKTEDHKLIIYGTCRKCQKSLGKQP